MNTLSKQPPLTPSRLPRLIRPGWPRLNSSSTPAEILRLEGDNNYTWVIFVDGSRQLISQTLKRYAGSQQGLLRIHKTHVVNPNYIQQVYYQPVDKAATGRFLLLKTGELLPWSRRCWRVYRQKIR